MASKQKLLDLLLQQGYFRFQEIANTYILAGQVLVNGQRIVNPKQKVAANACIDILDASNSTFSTEYHKINTAIDKLGLFVQGKICTDFCALRGGTTQSLIEHGAHSVYCYYRDSERLSKYLKSNPLCIAQSTLPNGQYFDPVASIAKLRSQSFGARLAVIHSHDRGLKNLLPYFRNIIEQGEILWHVRPIFEVDDFLAKRLGILNESIYLPFLQKLINTVNSYPGLAVQNICAASDTYYSKKPEFFLHILSGNSVQGFNIEETVLQKVIDEALDYTRVKEDSLNDKIKTVDGLRVGATTPISDLDASVIPLKDLEIKTSFWQKIKQKLQNK